MLIKNILNNRKTRICSGVRRIYFSRGRNTFEGGQKKNQGGRLAKNFCPPVFFSAPPAEFNSAPPAEFTSAPPAEFTSAPPAEFDFSPGAELTKERGGRGQKTLLYLEKEGETFNNRSLSKRNQLISIKG